MRRLPYFIIIFCAQIQAQSFESVEITGLTTIQNDSRSVNFIDINDDGWDDIFISNSSRSSARNNMYINNGDGSFTAVTTGDIVNQRSRFVGASFADADNDGDLDAYIVSWGRGTINYFYRNVNGTFENEEINSASSLTTFSEMIAWIDANQDQNLDIIYTNSAEALKNVYYENNAQNSFERKPTLSFLNDNLPTRSVDWVDYDGDGDFDLFFTNEVRSRNTLFRNDGPDQFTQITDLAIVNDNRNSAGSSWADIDNDGDQDLFIANYNENGQANQLFINNNGVFEEKTSSVISQERSNSFGSTFGDLDNDGDVDLIVCNSYADNFDRNFIYINDGKGNFTQDTSSALAQHRGWTYGCGLGDYDNNGWLDVMLANNQNSGQLNALFKNTGNGNHWMKIKCIGTVSNRSAIGTTIKVKATIDDQEVTQTRLIKGHSGYCAQNSYSIHFGLGDAEQIDEISISWPSGNTETFENLSVNQDFTLIEGDELVSFEDHTQARAVVLFPNPADSQSLHLTFTDHFNPPHSIMASIYNAAGVVIKQSEVNSIDQKAQINIAEIPNGSYFVVLKDHEQHIFSQKFLVQR